MLKVIKSQRPITKFKDEFNSIKHGNFYDFINLIKEPIPEMVVYSKGVIEVNPKSKIDDIDFIALVKAGPSLTKFHKECIQIYKDIKDDDISNLIFVQAALFEISLRMHAKNRELLNKRTRTNFIYVISEICRFKKMTEEETEIIQDGRKFINMIKHYKRQFNSWDDGIIAFNKAYALLNKYKLNIM